MADTFEIKLSLLTKPAKSALARLRKDRTKTRTKASSGIATARRKWTKKALGAGAGYATISNVTKRLRGGGAQVDPWAQAMVPIIATVQQSVDENIGFSASARRTARQDTVQSLAANVGAGASVTHAKEFFEIRDRIRQKEAKGLNIVRKTITGPSLDELMVAAVEGWFKLSGRAWTYFWDSIFG